MKASVKAEIRSEVRDYGRETRRWWLYVVKPHVNVTTRGITRTQPEALAVVCRVLKAWAP